MKTFSYVCTYIQWKLRAYENINNIECFNPVISFDDQWMWIGR